MKKRNSKNPLKETISQITELLNSEEKKYLPEFELLKIEVEKIIEPPSKIIFWQTEKNKYLSKIGNSTFATSGVVSYYIPNKELFLDRLISLEIDKLKALSPQQPETPTFKNNFDNITSVEIYKHFKAGLVDKQYLTEQELNEYLKAAFELKKVPETLFKLKHTPTKQKIYTVFYVYYKDISQKKHERQKDYAALLGDYFEGYKTGIIQTNWARDYKTKR